MAEGAFPATWRKIDFKKTFKVLVGREKHREPYILYDDEIIHRSSFFKSARSAEWSSGTKPVDLPNVKPEIFEAYLHCVRYGEIDVPNNNNGTLDYLMFSKVYVLADMLGDLQAVNIVVDRLFGRRRDATGKGLPNTLELKFAYRKTVASSPLRMLIRDGHVHEGSGNIGNVEADEGDHPAAMLYDIVMEYNRLKCANRDKKIKEILSQKAELRPKCHYHQHNDSHPPCPGATVIDI